MLGVLSTMANQNPGSVWSGTDAAVREQQKHDFLPKTWFGSQLIMKFDNDTKNSHIYVTVDIYSKSSIKNTTALRNLEIAFENLFSFLPPEGSFCSVGRGCMTKLTSEIKSAHRKRLGIGWINFFRVLAVQTSGFC